MSGWTGARDDRVRFNERTGPAALRRAGWFAAVACLGGLAFAVGSGWSSWAVAYWLSIWLVGWLANTLATTEWTIEGRELRRRRWLSRLGSEPSFVMELGPQVEIVHEMWGRWRIRPGRYTIDVQPWQASRLIRAMEASSVRVDDWHRAWTRRHRLLFAVSLLALYGGGVAVFAAMAFAPMRPGSALGYAAFFASLGVMSLGLAIAFLPWGMQQRSIRDSRWRQLPAGASGAWDPQSEGGPGQGLAFGGFWIRVAAYGIDVALLGTINLASVHALGPVGVAVAMVIAFAYVVGCWATTGQTIGMMAFGLRVVRCVDGRKVSWGQAVLRLIGLAFAFGCADIGVIWVAVDARKRGWHDIIGGTLVVRNVG